ncbi:hypothetical protein BC830DRAFT_1096790 [Chytriomyces sp. MP71]|nr:hypothetical protein BC830DRAFT_1096790 [Chytriomyces sp. MP71]
MTDLPDIKYPETSPFFEAVKAITSLRQHVELVREFRVLFYAQDQEPDKARREELYYRFVEMGQRLAGLCSEEDRTKFLLAIEIGRASNKKGFLAFKDEMVAVTDS